VDENAKCELYMKGLQLLKLAARLPELASKLERLNCSQYTPSTGENITTSFQLITRRVSGVIVEFHFAEATRDRYLANESYFTPCKGCLSMFTKIKLLIINRDSSSGVFCCFTSKV